MVTTDRPVLMLGAGGHARVLMDILALRKRTVIGVATVNAADAGTQWCGVVVIGNDESVLARSVDQIELVNGVGSTGQSGRRREAYDKFVRRGYRFATLVHPQAVVAQTTTLSDGVQVMAGAVIQPGTTLGENSIVNTNASVDHDCTIGAHVHLAPGCTISGGVRIADGVHVGAGATVIQGVKIGANSTVGAGAVVIRDLPANVTAVGVPARIL